MSASHNTELRAPAEPDGGRRPADRRRAGSSASGTIVAIPVAAIDLMKQEARRGYPEEVCGVLAGRVENGMRNVARAIPVDNARVDERARRYVIDADTLRRIERQLESEGLDVIGFYHSHPDHPAVPSTFDRDHSWPWYTYVILAIRSGEFVAARAWQLADDRSHFDETDIVDPETQDNPSRNERP